jgi:hypothetical protein
MREPSGKKRDLGSNITQTVAILQMKIIPTSAAAEEEKIN